MELNKHICTQLTEKARVFTQITLDDDYIVRDNKPDALHIIYTKGDIYIEDTKVGNQVVWITGKLRFCTLYQSDDENHRLDNVSGEIPFQEKIIMDEVQDGDELRVDIHIEDLTVGIINSRKLGLRAVLNIEAQNREEKEYPLACSVSEENEIQERTVSCPMLCLVENEKDVLRIQKEILMPNSRSNIGEIIFYQVGFRNEELNLFEDKMTIEMDVQIWLLYRTESTGEYECYETSIPVNTEISCTTLIGDEVFWARIEPQEVLVEPRGDYDGESRMLGLELALAVDVQIYREETCQILQDAYALDKELYLERENIPVHQLLVKNISKIRLIEQARLEKNQERILQICGSSGDITIDRVHRKENGILIEGVLNVHVLYNTVEDAMPYAHTGTQLPFEQSIEIERFSEDTVVWLDTGIEQLQVSLLDNSEYEVKAVLEIAVLAFSKNTLSNIVTIREEPLDMEALQKQPGMIGCTRGEGEDLWDIAKKYHATEENIIEIGNKVLVVKQI